jgi:HK97 family phage major capsid protein
MSEKNYTDMKVSELRSEIKSNFEEAQLIENKYPNGDYKEEDAEQVKSLLLEVDTMEMVLQQKEDAEARKVRITDGITQYKKPAPDAVRPSPNGGDNVKTYKSPGDQFIDSNEYKQLMNDGAFHSNLARHRFGITLEEGASLIDWNWQKRHGQKTLLYGSSDSSGGGWVVEDRLPGYVDIMQREIVFLDLVPRVPTTSDTVEYVTEDTFTNAAAMTAEATATTGTSGVKPESALAYSVSTSAVQTLAHWLPVTNRMLSDSPAIRGIINGRLLLGLDLTLETQVVSGDGTGANFTGLLQTAGINIQGLGTDNRLDALFKGRTLVRVNGKGRPSAFVLHPNDWEAIRLVRENAATATLGNYLMGAPSVVGPTTVFGIPVVESEAMTENTGFVGDFAMGCSLFDREQAAVRVGTIDDQFTRNMQTILAELRAAFVVFRPNMFTRITGI